MLDFVSGIAQQLAQVLAVGVRVLGEEVGECRVPIGKQTFTPPFQPLLRGVRPPADLARMIEVVAQGRKQCRFGTAQVLGQKLELAFVRNVRDDRLRFHDLGTNVVGDG